jgi:hypothetical protein
MVIQTSDNTAVAANGVAAYSCKTVSRITSQTNFQRTVVCESASNLFFWNLKEFIGSGVDSREEYY